MLYFPIATVKKSIKRGLRYRSLKPRIVYYICYSPNPKLGTIRSDFPNIFTDTSNLVIANSDRSEIHQVPMQNKFSAIRNVTLRRIAPANSLFFIQRSIKICNETPICSLVIFRHCNMPQRCNKY